MMSLLNSTIGKIRRFPYACKIAGELFYEIMSDVCEVCGASDDFLERTTDETGAPLNEIRCMRCGHLKT